MQDPQAALLEVQSLEARAARAAQAGHEDQAVRCWNRILEIEPRHGPSLRALGQLAFKRGDMVSARTAFERAAEASGNDAQPWTNVALACRALKDEAAEERAIQRALALDPSELVGLILRADLFDRQGKRHEAARAYGTVLNVSPPLERLHPELRSAVSRAWSYREQYDKECAAFLDRKLETLYETHRGDDLRRFRDSVDIVVGRARRYDSRSAIYHFPELAPIEFFDRTQFPWLDAIEAATDAIRDEFLSVLRADDGFVPYITYPDDVPHNQFAELNNSPRWSAFHLFKGGLCVEANAAKCPRTMEALAGAPQPDQPGRTPAAMFSLLKPQTRIPPHNGVTNTRLVTHLPLIVPEGCKFRVGNTTRQWVPGKAWVFDDTIEHEAINDSDKLRVVLIFDIWHPQLSPAERALVTTMTAGINEFAGGAPDEPL